MAIIAMDRRPQHPYFTNPNQLPPTNQQQMTQQQQQQQQQQMIEAEATRLEFESALALARSSKTAAAAADARLAVRLSVATQSVFGQAYPSSSLGGQASMSSLTARHSHLAQQHQQHRQLWQSNTTAAAAAVQSTNFSSFLQGGSNAMNGFAPNTSMQTPFLADLARRRVQLERDAAIERLLSQQYLPPQSHHQHHLHHTASPNHLPLHLSNTAPAPAPAGANHKRPSLAIPSPPSTPQQSLKNHTNASNNCEDFLSLTQPAKRQRHHYDLQQVTDLNSSIAAVVRQNQNLPQTPSYTMDRITPTSPLRSDFIMTASSFNSHQSFNSSPKGPHGKQAAATTKRLSGSSHHSSNKSANAVATKTTGSTTAKLLSIPCDADNLTPYQCLAREQIELFAVQESDLSSRTKGRSKNIGVGQVGIRCKHCAKVPHSERAKGNAIFPTRLAGIYQAAQNMTNAHVTRHCPHVPATVRNQLVNLGNKKSSAGCGKGFWEAGAKILGVVEDAQGLRFA